ncbi:MAG: hypothetical protein WC637_00320 [Victivallales bacterium]|jgi:hypothetical protein
MKEKELTYNFQEWTVPALFLILPFVILVPGMIWTSHHLFFILMVLPIIALSIKNLWVRSFLLYAFLYQITLLVFAIKYPLINAGSGLSVISSLIAAALVYKLVSESRIQSEKWFSIIRIAVILQVVISISQYLGFNPITFVMSNLISTKEGMPGDFVGTIGNRNYLMAFAAMSIPLFIGWKSIHWKIEKPLGVDGCYPWNIRINISLIVIFIVLCLAPSPATLAAVIGLAVYFNRGWKWIVISACIALAYVYGYVIFKGAHLTDFERLPDQLNQIWNTGKVLIPFNGALYPAEYIPNWYDIGRFSMWLTALSKLITSWSAMVFGFGPGAFWGKAYNLHSEYMAAWFYFGLIGLSVMIGYIYTTIRFLIKKKDMILLSAFVILCLDMGANHTLHIATTAFLAVIICGLIERERLIYGKL